MKSSLKHDIKFIVSRNESLAEFIYIYISLKTTTPFVNNIPIIG